MTDRELLELAAFGAGLHIEFLPAATRNINGSLRKFEVIAWHGPFISGTCGKKEWNPLGDDGDALRLAVKLNLIPTQDPMLHMAWVNGTDGEIYGEATYKECDLCEYAATRRAITRAAAAIGQSMKEKGK